jgi:hypothetical protein
MAQQNTYRYYYVFHKSSYETYKVNYPNPYPNPNPTQTDQDCGENESKHAGENTSSYESSMSGSSVEDSGDEYCNERLAVCEKSGENDE